MNDRYEPDTSHWNGSDDDEGAPSLPAFLLDPWGVFGRRWPWMLLALLVGLVASAVATYLVRPTFLAESTILITRQQIPEEFVRSTVQEDTIANINAMIGEVLSRENLVRLMEEQGMVAAGEAPARVSALASDFRRRIDFTPRESLSRGRRGEDSIIYGISYHSSDPLEAASAANALAGLFTEASIERRSSQARRTTAFLVRQLERDEAELREQSQRGSEFRREHRGELPDELNTNMRRLELLSERSQSLSAQIASAENRVMTLRAMPRAEDDSETAVLLDQLRRELAHESAVNTEEHPNVIALRERVKRLDEMAAEEKADGSGARVIEATQREISLLRSQLAEAQESIAEINARIDRTPAIAEELVAIEQKEQVLRERYLGSLRKVEDSQLAESLESAQQGAHISVLDRASVPSDPEQPRWLIAVGGAAASLALALALGVLLELVDPVVVSMSQLERLAGGPCLGSLPYMA